MSFVATKRWKCLSCGHEFETPWIPFHAVQCPKCGSKNVVRIDAARGRGWGPRWRRGLCWRFAQTQSTS